jgi:signal transduction histidine kinase
LAGSVIAIGGQGSSHINMKEKTILLAQRYAKALGKHLKQGARASLAPALALGRESVAAGLETLDLAGIHEVALVALLPGHPSRAKNAVIRRAAAFFTEANTLIEETHRAARHTKAQLGTLKDALGQRTMELAVSNRHLKRGIARRKSMEAALKKNGEHYARLLKESLQLQEGLRQLAHQVLAAQEVERKSISRELQDEIAQTLLGINVRLLSLKQQGRSNTKGLKNEIASTQRLVLQSVRSVRRVARKFGSL